MKKEVSDHIAKAFLEKRLKKSDEKAPFLTIITLSVIITLVFVTVLSFWLSPRKFLSLGQNIVLEKHDGPYVLDFNFLDSPSKVESLTIEIPDIDLSAYNKLKFSIRSSGSETVSLGALKVGLVNKRKETSSLYIQGVNNKWKRVSLPFADFKDFRNRSNLTQLTFTLEEWNLYPKKGGLLVDDIQFSK